MLSRGADFPCIINATFFKKKLATTKTVFSTVNKPPSSSQKTPPQTNPKDRTT